MGSCLSLAVSKNAKKETVALPEIPEELLIQILISLPAKSLMRFKCVSKDWLSMITSRYFTDLFHKSSSRQRRLFAYVNIASVKKKSGENVILTSLPLSHDQPVSVLIDQDLNIPKLGGYFVNALRGLACFRNGRRVQICNLHTRQLVELPIITSEARGNNVWCYLGHDHVHDEYKVLSLVWDFKERKLRSEHHVLVLGAKASWKKIQCHIPHYQPDSPTSISIDGVLYYETSTDEKRHALMSFDMSSEEFKLIELPNEGSFLRRTRPMNYKGSLAVFYCLRPFHLQFWVFDADKSLWSEKKTIDLAVPRMNLHPTSSYQFVMMGGTSRTSNVWLAKSSGMPTTQLSHIFSYDLERNYQLIHQRIELSPSLPIGKKTINWLLPYWDDIESITYLET